MPTDPFPIQYAGPDQSLYGRRTTGKWLVGLVFVFWNGTDWQTTERHHWRHDHEANKVNV